MIQLPITVLETMIPLPIKVLRTVIVLATEHMVGQLGYFESRVQQKL
jgi:hypothetical protein